MEKIKRIYTKNSSIVFAYIIAAVMFIFVSVFRPEFATFGHVKVMLIDAAILGTLAIGQTFVILIGGIDLSIQWNMCTSGIMFVMLYKAWGLTGWQFMWLILLCLAVTTAVGFLNGLGVAYLNMHPMIMTYGMNTIIQGVVVAVTSKGFPGGFAPDEYYDFCVGTTLNIPNLVLVWLVIIAIISILLARTPFGRKIYAVGNSETVAYFSGVKVKRIKMLAYAISGFAGGLGGLLFTGRIGQAYLGMGDPYLFQSVAVVAIGGTSMVGGSGNYIGTVGGTLILIILNSLLSAFLIPASWQKVIYGILLLGAVMLTYSRNIKQGRKA